MTPSRDGMRCGRAVPLRVRQLKKVRSRLLFPPSMQPPRRPPAHDTPVLAVTGSFGSSPSSLPGPRLRPGSCRVTAPISRCSARLHGQESWAAAFVWVCCASSLQHHGRGM
ncbi:uncharacterized protein M421DRAFT_299934 [Didymella exigua CBS 183.55]|uniref:Uncharacterized protein n=1 Tax=Didymella exigua CBS 183.55 TaxID=1150837 RepID=A0A6A5R9U1_9PLEO|nr:uncharacterized protein M421DRAFT_299934 [Didymella exigua CBS 183.55]KAF1924030.1 hypothetical protein M421DRAFT_299934 [Didymella exigua CBS 183.55]